MTIDKNNQGLELINKTIKKYSTNDEEYEIKNDLVYISIKDIVYKTVRINDEQYYKLSKNSISIEEDYVFLIFLSSKSKIYSSFSKMYTTMKLLFGESGNYFDDNKGSFSFTFLICFKKDDKEFEYIMNVKNVKSSIEFKINKLIDSNNEKIDINNIFHPFDEFSKSEINSFIAYFVGILDGYFKSYVSKTWDKFFFKKIVSENTLFGYKDGSFFDKKYERDVNFNKQLVLLEKINK